MKRILGIVLTVLLVFSAITPVMANNNITVKIDGQQIAFDVQPQLINSRTMVPLRAIFEALGATVDRNGDTQTVTSTKGGTTISLTINNPTMYVNGGAVTLDSPACLVGGRTLVPVRAISEAFGTTVDWDGATSTVNITSKQIVWYSSSMYRVGTDIPAGDYYAIKTAQDPLSGYYCKYNDSTQKDIEYNDNFDSFTFFRCYEGQYLKLSRCKITPIENAPAYSSNDGVYGAGVYRVGIDIPEGEYKFTKTAQPPLSGHYAVYTDITYEDIEGIDNFDDVAYYTIKNGQYLKIVRCIAVRIGDVPSSSNALDNTNSEIKMYENFPDVPDFGAFANISPVNTGSKSTDLFTYRTSEAVASKGSNVLRDYSKLLIELGFESPLIWSNDIFWVCEHPDTGVKVTVWLPMEGYDHFDIQIKK